MRPLRAAVAAALAIAFAVAGLGALVMLGAAARPAGASTVPAAPSLRLQLGRSRLPGSGGAVTVRLRVTGATSCRVLAPTAVQVARRWSPCTAGMLARVARLGLNPTSRSRRIRIGALARGPGGVTEAHAAVVQAGWPAGRPALSVVPAGLPGRGGGYTLDYDAPGASRCSLASSPPLWPGADPLRVSCDGTYQAAAPPASQAGRAWRLTFAAATSAGTVRTSRVLTERAPRFGLSSTALPAGVVGTPYSASLSAIGGSPPYRWRLVSGRLPAGLTLSSSGNLSGTPGSAGAFSFGVEVSDTSRPARHLAENVTMTVLAAGLAGLSANWAGEIVPSSTERLTEASATWTVPRLTCTATPNAGVSQWVGIGGVSWPGGGSSGALLQTGVRTRCVGGDEQAVAWWEEVPGTPNVEHDFTDLAVAPGDTIVATVSRTGPSTWLTQVDDRTAGASGVMVTGSTWGVLSDASTGRYTTEGSAAAVSYAGGYSAEWIVEDYDNPADGTAVPLADFGTISLSALSTSLPTWSLTPADAVEIVRNGSPLAVPSPAPGGGFSVAYLG